MSIKNIGTLRMFLAGFLGLWLALPAQASYTGLLVTTGSQIKEITSSGTLTNVDTWNTPSGTTLGAIAQGAQGTDTTLWLLNSAGTHLYKLHISAQGVHLQTNVGALGVTGIGLADVGGTLYTIVSNGTDYDLYTVDMTTGAATLSVSSFFGSGTAPTGLGAAGSNLLIGDGNAGLLYDTSGTRQDTSIYFYSSLTSVVLSRVAYDGTQIWILDNSAGELSNATTPTENHNYIVTVDATGVASYNGMCWGFVP